jgi:hypothetical protein
MSFDPRPAWASRRLLVLLKIDGYAAPRATTLISVSRPAANWKSKRPSVTRSGRKPIEARAGTHGSSFELSVANSGDPIPPAAVEKLFQPFYRAKKSDSLQGLGLGLFIASEIARTHGGTLEVDSTSEETRFTFQMPTKQSLPGHSARLPDKKARHAIRACLAFCCAISASIRKPRRAARGCASCAGRTTPGSPPPIPSRAGTALKSGTPVRAARRSGSAPDRP